MTNPIPGYATGIPDDQLLGFISWYTITDPKKTLEEVVELITTLDLDPYIIPNAPRLGDAFKRACRYSEKKGIPIPLTTNTANVLIRPVSTTAEEVERHMVLEEVDAKGKRLNYTVVAHLKFNRTNNVFSIDERKLPIEIANIVQAAIGQFNANFADAAKYIDSQVLRRMIRDQLDLMSAIGVRRQGSVYFYPVAQKAKGEALEEFCKGLGDGCTFHNLPLVNTGKQREMIRYAFESEVHDMAQQAILELNTKMDQQTEITSRAWAEYRKKLSDLQLRMTEYGALVETELLQGSTEMAALQEKLEDFLVSGLVKVGDD
jgi:hypothetical protein